MDIRPIKTKKDYRAALKEIEKLFEAAPNTSEGDRLEVLTTLVEAYEDQHYAIPLPDPVEAILYHMESRGLSRRDLEAHIGNRARVSEILNRKRPLTLRMIQQLHRELGIPAEVLLQPYRDEKKRTRSSLPRRLPPAKRLRPTRATRSSTTRSLRARG
jgi:HTH-type transcriptional regulator/antitoxin HigA